MVFLKNIATASLVFLFLMTSLFAADSAQKVEWLTMEEAQERFDEEPRMIFVDVYTNWCGWCRRMTNETFSHPVIAEILNTHFYPVKLNAEQEEPIVFRGVTYENDNIGQRRATHNFAIALLQGRMSYPSVVFFDDNMQLITALPGFRPPKGMEAVLAFFKTDAYKENPDLDAFISGFKGRITE